MVFNNQIASKYTMINKEIHSTASAGKSLNIYLFYEKQNISISKNKSSISIFPVSGA